VGLRDELIADHQYGPYRYFAGLLGHPGLCQRKIHPVSVAIK
jgi:hypothetical protein